jgi:hypothetical protein
MDQICLVVPITPGKVANAGREERGQGGAGDVRHR